MKKRFDLTGMSCSACSARVHKVVSGLSGVRDVSVNLLKNSMVVDFDEAGLLSEDIAGAVERAGYGAVPCGEKQNAASADKKKDASVLELRRMRRNLFFSFLFTVPLFFLASGGLFGMPRPAFASGEHNAAALALTQFLLAVPVVFVNFKFYRNGFRAFFSGAPNMDSLIAIGSGAAMVSGVWAMYRIAFALGNGNLGAVRGLAEHLHFESAAMILTLVSLGKFLEARAKGKASEAVTKLMDLAPKTAFAVRDGRELEVALEAVAVGDILAVRAGGRVPVDGVVTEGDGLLDESALTGESMPLQKGAGDAVTGATINTDGYFRMKATRVGADTTLARIVRLVDEATSGKAPIARLADRISGVFVPVVIGIAVCAAAFWMYLGQGVEFAAGVGIAVLVISCPCALGLATPTAIMVGSGRGAAYGILFKSAEAIEAAGRVDTVVLDKTGTVTEGRPAVTDLIAAEGVSPAELLGVAASLEERSGHPLGRAIREEAEKRRVATENVTDFRLVPGRGVAGMIAGVRVLAANAKMLQSERVENPLACDGERLAHEGKTPVYCARGGKLLGLLAIADPVKPDSSAAVAEMKAMGLDVVLLTGDNALTAQAVRRQVGIPRAIAEVLPQDKEREIRMLQEKGRHVAMIGDGINDAPALVRADVGIAIGAGTDIAIESAGIVLMKSGLLDASTTIQLSRAVLRNIRQNLFWAFFYNAIGIPAAAGVFYGIWGITPSPVFAAAAMSLSSVCVVSNALRLRFFTPKHMKGDAGANSRVPSTGVSRALTPTPEQERKVTMKKVISIEGMNCSHCTGAVEKALQGLGGVKSAVADLASKSATVEMEGEVSDEALKKAVVDTGFKVVGIK